MNFDKLTLRVRELNKKSINGVLISLFFIVRILPFVPLGLLPLQ